MILYGFESMNLFIILMTVFTNQNTMTALLVLPPSLDLVDLVVHLRSPELATVAGPLVDVADPLPPPRSLGGCPRLPEWL